MTVLFQNADPAPGPVTYLIRAAEIARSRRGGFGQCQTYR